MSKFKSKAVVIAILIAGLFGCGGEADEAKKLGFASVEEMKEVQAKGWHTKQKYEEDSLTLGKNPAAIKNIDGKEDSLQFAEYKDWMNVAFPEIFRRSKAYENINYVAQVQSGAIDLNTGIKKMTEQIDLCNSLSVYTGNLKYKTDPARQLSQLFIDGNNFQCKRSELILKMVTANNKEVSATVVEEVKDLDRKAIKQRESSNAYMKEACDKFNCGNFVKKMHLDTIVDTRKEQVTSESQLPASFDVAALAKKIGAERVADCQIVTLGATVTLTGSDEQSKMMLLLNKVFSNVYTQLAKTFDERELKPYYESRAMRQKSFSQEDTMMFDAKCVSDKQLSEIGRATENQMKRTGQL